MMGEKVKIEFGGELKENSETRGCTLCTFEFLFLREKGSNRLYDYDIISNSRWSLNLLEEFSLNFDEIRRLVDQKHFPFTDHTECQLHTNINFGRRA